MTDGPLIAVCLARQPARCNGGTTFTVYSCRNLPRGYVTRRSTRSGRRQRVRLLRPAPRTPPDLGAGLTARPDRDPGWSPWPTPHLQTSTIAFIAPRATGPARSPTSPGHGWPSNLPNQHLQARTAPGVLATSTPASIRNFANCTRPWLATPDGLVDLPADMEHIGNCRRNFSTLVLPPRPTPGCLTLHHRTTTCARSVADSSRRPAKSGAALPTCGLTAQPVPLSPRRSRTRLPARQAAGQRQGQAKRPRRLGRSSEG
jgi:hypothetical protein